jgi:flavin reductase (DIM6/NTAB) family NADH-FMN oxidoreductase RutF
MRADRTRKENQMMKEVSAAEALKHKYPEWIDLVVSRGADGQVNVMPVGWSTITSGTPLLYAVAIHLRQHTTRLIRESGEFVVAAPSASMAAAVLYCGTHSGRDGDKIGPAGLRLAPASVVTVPLLKGAVYNLECVVQQQVQTGDHILFVGQVVAAHLDEDVGPRLVNFNDRWGCAQIMPGTVFER